jgi:hypothetical protein
MGLLLYHMYWMCRTTLCCLMTQHAVCTHVLALGIAQLRLWLWVLCSTMCCGCATTVESVHFPKVLSGRWVIYSKASVQCREHLLKYCLHACQPLFCRTQVTSCVLRCTGPTLASRACGPMGCARCCTGWLLPLWWAAA